MPVILPFLNAAFQSPYFSAQTAAQRVMTGFFAILGGTHCQ